MLIRASSESRGGDQGIMLFAFCEAAIGMNARRKAAANGEVILHFRDTLMEWTESSPPRRLDPQQIINAIKEAYTRGSGSKGHRPLSMQVGNFCEVVWQSGGTGQWDVVRLSISDGEAVLSIQGDSYDCLICGERAEKYLDSDPIWDMEGSSWCDGDEVLPPSCLVTIDELRAGIGQKSSVRQKSGRRK